MRDTQPLLFPDPTDRAAWQATFDQDITTCADCPPNGWSAKPAPSGTSIGMGIPYTRFRASASTGTAPSSPYPWGCTTACSFGMRRGFSVPSAVSATKPTTSGGQGRGSGNPTEAERLVVCLCW